MSDPRFFHPQGPFTLAELAFHVGGSVRPESAGDRILNDVSALLTAGPAEIAFLDNRKYLDDLRGTRAGAAIVAPAMVQHAPAACPLLVHPSPYKAYARVAQMFHPLRPGDEGGIAAGAVIHPTATLGSRCRIAAGVVIGARADIGERVWIGAGSVVGDGVVIGDDTVIDTLVSLSHCLIGARVRILPGVRIGQEGFGFAIDPAGHIRIPQLGRVIVEDDVEIGANSTIDRGAGPDTIIGRGSMIDNLVQIGHNVVLGPGCIIVAQAGIAGSTQLEAGVALGGQVGVAGHLTIGAGAQIAGQSGIMRDVPAGSRMMGYPAVTTRQFFRQVAWLSEGAARGGNEG